MKTITVNASKKYDVLIGEGLLADAGKHITAVHAPCAVMLVSDSTVMSLYGEQVKASLSACGFSVNEFVIAPGEASKSTATLVALWEALASAHISRSDLIIALGGGVPGDLAGFAAATYLRGIDFVGIPTTLLAMVDSSVGGKTAVDLEAGKNLAGAFHQPSLVLCDPSALATLPQSIYNDGMAEVIKYAMINHAELLTELAGEYDISAVIALCIDEKRRIVDLDERDTGIRRLLNLGHTAAHGIELCSEYGITHGSAVAAGMAIITRAAVKKGLCTREALEMLEKLLNKFSLPLSCEYSAEELCKAALEDKKRFGDSITLAVPRDLGKAELMQIPISGLLDFISGAWEND